MDFTAHVVGFGLSNDADAPATVQTGASFTVGWAPTINRRDYVTIVPVGTDERAFGTYSAVTEKSDLKITAPAEPGLYELRYVLNVNRRTVAAREIELTDPQMMLGAPETALTREAFPVRWTGAVDGRDYITIVPTKVFTATNWWFATTRLAA